MNLFIRFREQLLAKNIAEAFRDIPGAIAHVGDGRLAANNNGAANTGDKMSWCIYGNPRTAYTAYIHPLNGAGGSSARGQTENWLHLLSGGIKKMQAEIAKVSLFVRGENWTL